MIKRESEGKKLFLSGLAVIVLNRMRGYGTLLPYSINLVTFTHILTSNSVVNDIAMTDFPIYMYIGRT